MVEHCSVFSKGTIKITDSRDVSLLIPIVIQNCLIEFLSLSNNLELDNISLGGGGVFLQYSGEIWSWEGKG